VERAPVIPSPSVVWIDGRPMPGEEARVSVFDRGFLYGDSVYEVTRTVAGAPLFLAEHLVRLTRSAAALEMALPPGGTGHIAGAVAETVAALGAPRAYLRIVLTRGAGEISLDPIWADRPNLIVIAKPLKLPDERLYREGAALCLVAYRRNAPGHVPALVKSGNYLTSVLAMIEVRRRGGYEALFCDGAGHLAEGASSNFFVVRGGEVLTPPLAVGVLHGITRQVVLDLLAREGVPWREALLTPEDAVAADEAFLTSSVRGVLPVVRLDDRVIGPGRPGPVTRRLMQAYGDLIGEPPC
jgi:branched-chain amino acid aminotransferase